ncbi:DUF4113 domain-containing protein [Aeromonas enteropelogenes]|uniref:DUF4113 domain-containing protein n=1 Tax=Aeromonas enteropelogenes TaxID=29489 RepID=UPI003B9E7C90
MSIRACRGDSGRPVRRTAAIPAREALMQVIDKINQRRLGKVYFAARGRDTREWMMKREQLSPPYTTALGELPVVK